MFQMVGQTVAGGWNALQNVIDTVGKGAGTLVGGFFPAPQRTEVEHLPVAQMGGTGQTYRPTAPDAPSLQQTYQWAMQDWLGSPYQEQLSPTRRGTTGIEQVVKSTQTAQGPIETIADIWRGVQTGAGKVLEVSREIRTSVDEFMELWGLQPREPIPGTPREGYPEGRDETHYQDVRAMGAAVYETVKGWGENFISQIKGLFSIGYEPTEQQGGFRIKHELEPSRTTMMGVGLIVAVLVVVYLLGQRK